MRRGILRALTLVGATQGRRDEKGTTAMEYALVIALCGIVLYAAVFGFGAALAKHFDREQAKVSTWDQHQH